MTNPIPTPWARTGPPSRRLMQVCKERVKCPTCGRMCASTGLGRHMAACMGVPVADRLPVGHRLCGVDGCTRWRPGNARCCWRCEEKDRLVFAALDAAIAAGKREDA